MPRFTHLRSLLLAGAAVTVLAAGPVQAGMDDNTLVYGQSLAVTDLGPAYEAFLNYPAGYEASFLLYDRLVTFDEELKFHPQLAESWEISEDQTAVTFHLREGATFHDGTPVDAEAIKFNIERMMDPEVNNTNRPLWDPIVGADVVDDLTVTIRTDGPYALLLNTLAHGSGAIVSPSAIEANGPESMTQNPVGAGPYKLASFEPGQELVLEPFAEYWGGKPALDGITLRYIPEAATRVAALKSGSVDVIDGVPSHLIASIESDANLQILSGPSLRPMGFAIQTTKPPLDIKEVRQALNHAVPVEAIADKLFFGYAKPSDSPLAFNTFGHRGSDAFAYDQDKAKDLLAAAGYTDTDNDGFVDKDGEKIELTLLTPEGQFASDVQITEVVANALQAVGIDAKIEKIEKGAFWDALRVPVAEATWDLGMFGFNPSNASGSYHLDSMYTSNPDNEGRPAVWNIARYANADVDALLAEAKTTVDPEKRAELLGDAQEIIWDDAPYVWLQVNDIVSAASSDVKGVEVWPIIFTIVRDAHY